MGCKPKQKRTTLFRSLVIFLPLVALYSLNLLILRLVVRLLFIVTKFVPLPLHRDEGEKV